MIKLNDKYAIKSDAHQWILCKWGGKPKKEGHGDGWEPIKYYASIRQLVKGTSTLFLRKSQYTSFRELLGNQREINALIDDKLKGL